MSPGELDKERAREQRIAAERAFAEDLARQRRSHRIRVGVLALVGLGALAAGALAGGVGFAGGLAVLGGVVVAGVRMSNPANKSGEQARPTPGAGPFTQL